MKILDTNFICSLFNQLDPNHQKAKDIFFDIDDNEKISVPFIVATELSVSSNSSKYLSAAKEISSRFIPNNEDDLDYITSLSNSKKHTLKANDCLIISLCKRLKAELLTFDKKLGKFVASN